MNTPSQNYHKIKKEIEDRCKAIGRNPEDIKILLATKTQSLETLKVLSTNNLNLFGENKVQELILKQNSILTADWHFIGHLQTNKAKDIIGRISLLHSLDSLKLANKLNTLLANTSLKTKLNVLIQVNTSQEPTKHGFLAHEVEHALKHIEENCPHINPKGFMTMAAPQDITQARNNFKELKALSVTYNLPELSMGMSNDYMVAIEEGSTLVRLGSCIFGKRS